MNILLLETIADEALEMLQNETEARILTAYGDQSLAEIVAQNDIDAVITRGKGQANKALMDACPNLKVITRCGVGLDNVDVAEATARKIKVVNAPGVNAATIAEHTISLMLMLQRNMYQAVTEVKANNWNWRNQFVGDELNGKTLGILGLGNIGTRVAKIANAMGMNIVYWNDTEVNVPYRFTTFEDVLRISDVISIHLPLLPETSLLINEKTLALMKPTALLINTARGQIIDESALLNALNNNQLAGFGADVLSVEPPQPDNGLTNHPKTHITAHVGSLTATTYVNMCVQTVGNTLAILKNETPQLEGIFNRKALAL